MNKKIVYGLIVVLAISLGLVIWSRGPTPKGGDREVIMDAASVKNAVRAAAILENNKFDEAIGLYEDIVKKNPSNSVAKKNLAVAYIGKLGQQIKFLSDPKRNANEIRSGLPAVIDAARSRIDQAIEARKDDPACYQLDVELDIARISLLDALISGDDQIALVEKLKGYVEKFPEDTFMVTRFENQVDTIQSTAPEYLEEILEPLMRACRSHPRNLFMLNILIKHMSLKRDPRVFEFVDRFVELLKPFRWQIEASNANYDFKELLSVKDLSSSDPEEACRILGGWVGISNSTSGSKADARLSLPNVLALIDLSDVESGLSNQTVNANSNQAQFEKVASFKDSVQGVLAFDWNVDTIQEVVSWTGSTLSLSSIDETGSLSNDTLATLELPFEIHGVVPADLFQVGTGTPTKPLESTVAAPSERTDAELAQSLKSSKRHQKLRDLVVFGGGGVRVVKFATPPTTTSNPEWSVVNENIGLSEIEDVVAVLPVDWDADSDLDLVYISNGNRIMLMQNKGNRTFENVNEESLLPSSDSKVLSGVIVDFDRDVDLDVVLSCQNQVLVLENILHGQFRYRELDADWRSLANAVSLATGEIDGNYSWDYVAQTETETVVLTTNTIPSNSVTPRRVSKTPLSQGLVTLQDWNNDGLLDAAIASAKVGLVVLTNNEGSLSEKNAIVGLASLRGKAASIDFNHDGLLDVVAVAEDKIAVVQNKTTTGGNYSDVRLSGQADENGGGRINHFSVGSIVEFFSPTGYQARIMEDDSVHFGYRNTDPYNLRVVFPNGLTQNTVDPPKNQLVEEIQIPKGSCPFLYAWDGTKWALVTDLLWNAPLGLQYAKGKPLPDRRWEHLLLDGKAIQPTEDFYELRVTEELWESAYFDHVALSYVDHPSDIEVHSNEKVGPPSIAQPGLWFAHKPSPLIRATDKYGRDWTKVLQARDRQFALPFDKRICQGLVEEHWLELDFGTLDTTKPLQLYLTGWIYPTDTSINIGLDQNPDVNGPVPPSLWTVGEDGKFRKAVPFTGFPGGKPKTIVIPLDGVLVSSDHRIRIQHSSEIYWDQAFVAYGEFHSLETETTKLHLQSAQLDYRGFSKEVLTGRSQPHWYDYNQTNLEPNWPPMMGKFTRYGDVLDIVANDDDHIVVMGAGDEMRLRFELPSKPVAEGFTRDLVMHNVGWDKDADLNTLDGQSSLPLPFSKMKNYPPPADQRDEAIRVQQLHRKTLTREQDVMRFWQPNARSQ